MKLMIIIGGSLFPLMFLLAIIFPGGRIQSVQERPVQDRMKANLWLGLLALAMLVFGVVYTNSNWGDDIPVQYAVQQQVQERAPAISTAEEDPPRLACRYAVTTFQTRFDTIQIANFEPLILPDRYTAPPQPVVIYGKEANHRLWEGTFARHVRALEKGGIVLAVTNWERMGPCWVHKAGDPRADVPAR